MKIFEVPRRQIEARVIVSGGETMVGVLYTAATGPTGGPGRLSDRLNDPQEAFLPLATPHRRCLLNKERIVEVHVAIADEELEFPEGAAAHRAQVRVTLAGGSDLEGSILYTMPSGQERLLDYLNAAPRFLPVLCGETVILVNRSYVVAIVGIDED